MKKLLFGTIVLALVSVFPIMTMAAVDISIGIPLPPPIVFAEPPEMVVLPETEVYVVPNAEQDIFFWNGWWWRPWEGRWYRSREYTSGWGFYQGVPSWYAGVPLGWRDNYRNHMWGGRPWNYRRIPHNEFRQNWRGWQRDGYWRNQRNWGTEGRYRQHQRLDQGTRKLSQGQGTRTKYSSQGQTTGTRQFNKGQTTRGTKQIYKSQTAGQHHQGTGTAVEKHYKK